jgi:catechol 2,3-dioxygenase-like lactoylglutathione lyase family enzyme
VITAVFLTWLAAGAPGEASSFEAIQPYLVGIGVADAGASAKWYEDKLGFVTYRRMDLPERGLKIVFLRSGAFRLELVEKAGAVALKKLAPDVDEDQVLGLKKLAFAVGNVDAAAARLRTQGVRFVVEPFDDGPMKLRSFIVADPDGNLLQFMQETR